MAGTYLREALASHTATPQHEPIPGREAEQVVNSAGGYVFAIDDFARLDRFLILGSEGNTYYATEQKLTRENARAVQRAIKQDGLRVVARVVEISDAGRAPKNDPALFVLALCAASEDVAVRRAALAALAKVARIGTHLFHFIAFAESLRGWGRALSHAVKNWYLQKRIDALAMDVVKYRQRDGWSHRDLIRLSHPKADDSERRSIIDWAVHGDKAEGPTAFLRAAIELMGKPSSEKRAGELIRRFNLPRECVPTNLLNSLPVWDALLEDMPMTAMIRNLGKMSSIELITPMSDAAKHVVSRLDNADAIEKARVHPIAILMALKTYAQGHGERGKLSWTPAPNVVDALDRAFYSAFKTVRPTGKRILLALDVSGSMGSGSVAGTSLTPREGAAAMALVIASTEANYHIVGFTSAGHSFGRYGGMYGPRDAAITPLDITPRRRLDDVVRYTANLPFGGTDCSLPMQYAQRTRLDVDAFIVITDNETWAGQMHPVQALANYRKERCIPAKLVVIGMTATQFSIADPNDNGMLDVVGFDAAAPQVIADFIRE